MRADKFVIAVSTIGIFAGAVGAAPALRPEPPTPGPTLIDLNSNGDVVRKGQPTISKIDDVKELLKGELARQKLAGQKTRVRSEPVMILRVDRHAPFAKVHAILSAATEVGFKDVTMEAGNAP